MNLSKAGAHLGGKRLPSTIQFQRTANSLLTICLNPGDNPAAIPKASTATRFRRVPSPGSTTGIQPRRISVHRLSFDDSPGLAGASLSSCSPCGIQRLSSHVFPATDALEVVPQERIWNES